MALNFPDSPIVGDVFTSGVLAWRWDGTKWVVSSQGPSGVRGDGVNILRRNGGLEVWQRGAGGSANILAGSAGALYGPDGWYLNIGVGATYNMVQVAGLADGSMCAAKVQRTPAFAGVVQPYFGFPLDTDELWPIRGQFVRLSFTAKAGANWSPASGAINAQLYVGTGTPVKVVVGYTGPVVPINGIANLTATAVRYQFNSSTSVPVTATQAEVVFTWIPVGTSGADDSFTIDDVQLEIVPAATGYVASPFQRLNFQEQLLLCQRHYFKSFQYATAPVDNAAANGTYRGQIWQAGVAFASFDVRFPVQMRVTAAGTLYNASVGVAGQLRNINRNADFTVSSVGTSSQNGANISGTSPASTVLGDQYVVHYAFDAGI